MAIETLLSRPIPASTAYPPRHLRERLTALRRAIAREIGESGVLYLVRGRTVPVPEVLSLIDAELAPFAALDALLAQVATSRKSLRKRLPVLAAAISSIELSLKGWALEDRALRARLAVPVRKKHRKLKPEERMAATEMLRATRQRNGTTTKNPRRRR